MIGAYISIGLPKPAIVTHLRVLAASSSFNVANMNADDIVYIPLPLYHSAALLLGFGNAVTKGWNYHLYEQSTTASTVAFPTVNNIFLCPWIE